MNFLISSASLDKSTFQKRTVIMSTQHNKTVVSDLGSVFDWSLLWKLW